jgi:23S rRNA (uracil1939-C5)-methyltransferase
VNGSGATDSFEAEVAGLDQSGSGIAEVVAGDGLLRVHVPGALPGERIAGRITYRSVHERGGGREAWATLQAVLRPSPDRVSPACPGAGCLPLSSSLSGTGGRADESFQACSEPRCGGCSLMHLAYPSQLAWKGSRVREEFAKHPELSSVEVAACVSSPATLGYRNQAKYVYARTEGGELVLGAYAPGTHEVVDLAGCHVIEPVLDEARRILLGILSAQAVEPYHETRGTGLLRYAVLRSSAEGRVLATLIASRGDWPSASTVAAELIRQLPAVSGVVLNVNSGTGNALFGKQERLLVGQATLVDGIGDVRVRLASRSFFQANRAVASRIYRDLVAALLRDLDRAVDAYSGAGGIALSLLPLAREVVAIEENPAATEVACESPSDRLRVVTADAAVGLAAVESAGLVVLNPPRKGCSAEVLSQLRRLAPPEVAYLSCDPATLARDLAVLVRSGAVVESVIPYDMMPHTPHVETLVRLSWGR